MVFKATDVESALCRKGFVRKGGDHRFFIYRTKEGLDTTIQTKVSHSATDVGKELISLMSKQCGLSKNQFADLVRCPLSRDRYEEILKEKHAI